MVPVAAKLACCGTLIFSAGLVRSPIPAATNPHLKAGAQKNTVLGPAINQVHGSSCHV